MKILYLSDNYAAAVYGTKISLFREIQRRGISITFCTPKSRIIEGDWLENEVRTHRYTVVWCAHSWFRFRDCPIARINAAGAKMVGTGFSDPYGRKLVYLSNFNYYITNHWPTKDQALAEMNMPIFWLPTACDTNFHRRTGQPKTTDVILYGVGRHPHFVPNDYRIQTLQQVRKLLPGRSFEVFGGRWDTPKPKLVAEQFIDGINRARLSLDLQQTHAPWAHRMFECGACGTPAITRRRPCVVSHLEEGREIFYYDDAEDLAATIEKLLTDKQLPEISNRIYEYVRANHDVRNRVDSLLAWFGEIGVL